MDGETCVAHYFAPHEAELAAMHLRAHGIDAKVGSNSVAVINPLWGLALGGIRVNVPARDAEEARTLLAALEAKEAPDPASTQVLHPRDKDNVARRAWAACILAFITVPVVVHLYSLFLLARLGRAPGVLSARGRRHVALALVLDALTIAGVALALVWNA
jgi:hypothetical protein